MVARITRAAWSSFTSTTTVTDRPYGATQVVVVVGGIGNGAGWFAASRAEVNAASKSERTSANGSFGPPGPPPFASVLGPLPPTW
jgi:hypothetical protein